MAMTVLDGRKNPAGTNRLAAEPSSLPLSRSREPHFEHRAGCGSLMGFLLLRHRILQPDFAQQPGARPENLGLPKKSL
jgi:hypothetical protein